MSKNDERMAWSGWCDDCGAQFVVYPGDEAEKKVAALIAEGPDEWDSFSDCFVCDGSITWNGSDPVREVLPRA